MSCKLLAKKILNEFILKRFNLKVYSTRPIGREIIVDVKKIIPEPAVLFDVGANIGQTAALWHQSFPAATIHSFEPVKHLYDMLYKHHADKAICNHQGLGNSEGLQTIYYGKAEGMHSFAHQNQGLGSEQTNVTTVDRYCSQNNISHIDLIKIDVEGYEHEVIEGSRQMLKNKKVDLVLVELGVDPDGYYIFYPDFARMMQTRGYYTVGFYDQINEWDGSAKLLFCNVLFARDGLNIKK